MILGIYGASGLGTEFHENAIRNNALSNRWSEIVYVDDDPEKVGKDLTDCRIISYQELCEMNRKEVELVLSIGEPEVKDRVFDKVTKDGFEIINLFWPGTEVLSGAKLGKGVVVQDDNKIPPMAELGNCVLIQGKTVMGHGVKLGDNVVISSFAFVGGDTVIGKNTYIAPHSCLRNGIHIGENVVIGMGSVVTKDIPDNAVAYGTPCEVKRINEKGRVFSK